MSIIFLSDGYLGGANRYLEQNINYCLQKKENVILFDKNPSVSFKNIKKNEYFKIYKIDPVTERGKVKKIINQNKEINKHIFFFTNYVFLIYYFIYFSFSSNFKHVVLSLHSGIFKWTVKNILATIIFSIISYRISHLIYGSFSSKQWWEKYFPWMKFIKNSVIYNGVKLKIKKKVKKKKYNVSFVGRLEQENNPQLFLKITNLLKENDKIKFNIFGDGSLKKLFFNKKLNFKYWGWSDRSVIYKNTDILIITSPINNFPYAALESQSYGIPVITSSQGDVRKIIKNNFNGYIFNSNDPKKYEMFIKKTIDNYNILSENSYKRAKNFDTRKSCKNIWSFIKN